MARLRRGEAKLEEKREAGADLRRQPRPMVSWRSQFREQMTGRGMTTWWTRGERTSGAQWIVPTRGQNRPWRPWPTEMRNWQTHSPRKRRCCDESLFRRMSTTNTSNYPQQGVRAHSSLSKRSTEPYMCCQSGKPEAQSSCRLEPYVYSGSGRDRASWI